MAIEIEVKAKLKDRQALLKKLSALGCVFSEPKTQVDRLYVERVGPLDVFLANKVFVRIRIEDNSKVILTAKKPKNLDAENLIKREHEVEVDSAEEVLGILQLMGLTEAVLLKKTRQIAKYKEFEICIDDIEGLGAFIEVEAMGEEDNAKETQNTLWALLDSLGVAKEDQVNRGYDILMLEKQAN